MSNRESIGKHLMWAGLAFVVAFFAIVASASGQNRDDVQAQLEKTDNLLESARDIVREAGSDRGQAGLKAAEELQAQAWDAYHRGRLGMALRLTERARDEIYRALGSIRQSEDNENEVERQLERTDMILGEARDRLGPGRARMPQHRLDAAFNLQRRAWDLFRERRLRPALKLTLQAREAILRLGGGPFGGGPGFPDDPRALEAQFERLTEAAERAGERVAQSENDAAKDLWERAVENLKKAEEALNAGDGPRAERLLQQTREQLERAVRLVLREVRTDEVEVLIVAATERWELLQSAVNEAAEDQLRDWHEMAAGNLERARQALSEGKSQRALVETRRAVELLDKIDDELGD